MHVPNVSSYRYSNVQTRNKTNFKGLTKTMEKAVLAMPVPKQQELLSLYEKPFMVVGHFPKDILKLIQKSSSSKEEVGSKIRKFQECLAFQAQKITNLDKEALERAENDDIKDFLYAAVTKAVQYQQKDSLGHVAYPLKIFSLSGEKEELLNDKIFDGQMKKIGLMSTGEKVYFSFVGQGSFKNCFKIQILDKDGKNKIHPKAFVVEKRENLGQEINKIFKRKISEYFEKTDYETFKNDMLDKLQNDSRNSIAMKLILEEELPCFYQKQKYKTVWVYDGGMIFDDFKEINGVFPEANAALKIRKDLNGQMDDVNMIRPYIFDLKHKYGLLEFADKELGPIKRVYDFSKNGIRWIDDKPYNSCYKRLIDYGCIFPVYKDYFND